MQGSSTHTNIHTLQVFHICPWRDPPGLLRGSLDLNVGHIINQSKNTVGCKKDVMHASRVNLLLNLLRHVDVNQQ